MSTSHLQMLAAAVALALPPEATVRKVNRLLAQQRQAAKAPPRPRLGKLDKAPRNRCYSKGREVRERITCPKSSVSRRKMVRSMSTPARES